MLAWIDSHREVPCLVQNVCADLPPQVDNMDSALYWIAFTHAFIHHCLNYNFDKVKTFHLLSTKS